MVKIFKNFLTKEECKELTTAAKLGRSSGWLNEGLNRGQRNYSDRFTSRFHMKDHEYPEIVKIISKQVRKFCNIDNYPIIDGHGKNGVVVSMTFNGGDTYEHCDPRSEQGHAAYRCNILTQKPAKGGMLFVDGEFVDIEEGDLHCYLASEYRHYVTPTIGDIPRILWMFGAYVPLDKIETLN